MAHRSASCARVLQVLAYFQVGLRKKKCRRLIYQPGLVRVTFAAIASFIRRFSLYYNQDIIKTKKGYTLTLAYSPSV